MIGKEKLSEYTANIAFAGFTAPKLLWVKENEPENFAKICKIMLPKDYLAYCLTGVHCCDYSDASGMLLLDVKNKCWSEQMMEICGVSREQMPELFESYEKVGTLKPEVAKELGLPETCLVGSGVTGIMLRQQWEPVQWEMVSVMCLWEPAEQFLFPVRISAWIHTMPACIWPMLTDIII